MIFMVLFNNRGNILLIIMPFRRPDPLEIPSVAPLIPDGILQVFDASNYFNFIIDKKKADISSVAERDINETFRCFKETIQCIKNKYDCVSLEDFKKECKNFSDFKNCDNIDVSSEIAKIANDLNIIIFIIKRNNNLNNKIIDNIEITLEQLQKTSEIIKFASNPIANFSELFRNVSALC